MFIHSHPLTNPFQSTRRTKSDDTRHVKPSTHDHNRHIQAHDGDARPRAVHVLRHGAIASVSCAFVVIVGRRGVHASVATRGAHEQLKGASIKDSSDGLAPDLEVSKVLHILEVAQLLTVKLRRRDPF